MPMTRNQSYEPRRDFSQPETSLRHNQPETSFLHNMNMEASAPDEKTEREGLDRLQRSLVWLGAVLVAFSVFMDIRNYFL